MLTDRVHLLVLPVLAISSHLARQRPSLVGRRICLPYIRGMHIPNCGVSIRETHEWDLTNSSRRMNHDISERMRWFVRKINDFWCQYGTYLHNSKRNENASGC